MKTIPTLACIISSTLIFISSAFATPLKPLHQTVREAASSNTEFRAGLDKYDQEHRARDSNYNKQLQEGQPGLADRLSQPKRAAQADYEAVLSVVYSGKGGASSQVKALEDSAKGEVRAQKGEAHLNKAMESYKKTFQYHWLTIGDTIFRTNKTPKKQLATAINRLGSEEYHSAVFHGPYLTFVGNSGKDANKTVYAKTLPAFIESANALPLKPKKKAQE